MFSSLPESLEEASAEYSFNLCLSILLWHVLLVMHFNQLLALGRAVTTDKSHTSALHRHKQMRCGGITVGMCWRSGMGGNNSPKALLYISSQPF